MEMLQKNLEYIYIFCQTQYRSMYRKCAQMTDTFSYFRYKIVASMKKNIVVLWTNREEKKRCIDTMVFVSWVHIHLCVLVKYNEYVSL